MYIFTLWNQSPMPHRYAKCIAAMRERYPSLDVVPFVSPEGEDPRYESDRLRFRILLATDGPAWYVDADCLPGSQRFLELPSLAFANECGGRRELWSIYSPGTVEAKCELRRIVDAIPLTREHLWWVAPVTACNAVALYGYPNYEHVCHRQAIL